jgi:hypothetical protein
MKPYLNQPTTNEQKGKRKKITDYREASMRRRIYADDT